MALDLEADLVEEQEEVAEDGEVQLDAPAHHPSAPPDELFDISTTVDPSYIISLIRKLLPTDASNNHDSLGVDVRVDINQVENTGHVEECSASLSGDEVLNSSNNNSQSMEIVGDYDPHAQQEGEEESCRRSDQPSISSREEAREEYGCILWDLSASKTNAELMAQNHVLEVLLANLLVSQSVRVKEISLGIIGNLACHEFPLKHIVSTNGLVVNLLTLGFQSGECITWAEALQSEHILCLILWIVENSLNLQLIEKSVGLLLAVIESQPKVVHVLLPPLMKLGLPSLLINLLTFEMSKLTSERIPERYPILDDVLHAIEALSAIDGYSQGICSNKELFRLACDMVKLPDKVEVHFSLLKIVKYWLPAHVTVAVLIANILSDVSDLASEISQDLPFLWGLLEIFPFASDDLEARSALWSIIARLLFYVQENEMSQSIVSQYVSVLVSKSNLIEDDLLDHQLDDSSKGHKEGLTTYCTKSNAISTALRRMICILTRWTASNDSAEETNMTSDPNEDNVNVNRLLDCCR
ncbi:hypothetical protein FH972_026798 [Carpinus fangiana]|uniref:Protein saal1 n=1 Tax=Carpinus fangiana TaxID=176857 RepID=A0A5N6L522_9ROSI|nr:hypothetical protein FH972_026798 [Carpinus fangiana]